ncbi:TolC family protein [Undibacterium umbellatum]|uniref:TolC family protein n=1 Tax=Undibacterium umbellatum TaxID=2762300 RepID=A0ABR6ZIH2_9BURK|nr:TolC family protein [Undibacterium umbellatum]MBC3911523.1 TolC family protein [Undibacterium umbellatum]
MYKISVCLRALSRGRSSVTGAILILLLGSGVSLSHAAETPSFAALLQQAQLNAPYLLEQAANVRAASADARQAGAWANPSLSVTAENLGAPLSGGLSQRQDTYAITQVFEVGGKRSARIEAEQLKSAAVGAREREARVSYANELAIRYATAEAMQQRKEVADAELTRAEDDFRAAQALVKAGREAELRLAQARASVAAAQAAVQSASADATESLERLTALVGATESFTQIDHPFLATASAVRPAGAWSADATPALASAVAERDAVAAQIRVEEKRWLPDIGVSVGMRKFGWSTEKAATIGLTANIPLFDRNQSGVTAARERAASASMRVEAARLETTALHRSALVQVQASEKRLQAAEQGEAAAGEAYRLGRVGYDAGKTALVELLAIRRALSEAKALTIDARLSRVRALATLSTAEGRIAFGESP